MNTTFATIAASALALTMPLAASSAPFSPVIVQSVATAPGHTGEGIPGDILVAFQNESDVTANAVEFRITDAHGADTLIDDVGTFAKGVTVRHDYRVRGLSDGGQAQVVEVKFEDGSVWELQAPAAPQPRRQAGSVALGGLLNY